MASDQNKFYSMTTFGFETVTPTPENKFNARYETETKAKA